MISHLYKSRGRYFLAGIREGLFGDPVIRSLNRLKERIQFQLNRLSDKVELKENETFKIHLAVFSSCEVRRLGP